MTPSKQKKSSEASRSEGAESSSQPVGAQTDWPQEIGARTDGSQAGASKAKDAWQAEAGPRKRPPPDQTFADEHRPLLHPSRALLPHPERSRFALWLIMAPVYAAAAYVAWPFVHDVIWAWVLTAISWPLYARLRRRFSHRFRDECAALCTIAVISVLFLVLMGWLVSSLAIEAHAAYEAAETWLASHALERWVLGDDWLPTKLRELAGLFGVEISLETVADGSVFRGLRISIAALTQYSAQLARTLVTNLATGVLHVLLVMVLVYAFLVRGHRLRRWVSMVLPLPQTLRHSLAYNFEQVSKATLFGNGLGSVLQGLFGGALMALFGLPSSTFWGAVMSLFAFLPVVGVSVVIVPAAIYLGATGSLWLAIVFFAVAIVGATILENVVKTRLISRYMRMDDILVFFSILGGIAMFGVPGLLYGPLILASLITLAEAQSAPSSHGGGNPVVGSADSALIAAGPAQHHGEDPQGSPSIPGPAKAPAEADKLPWEGLVEREVVASSPGRSEAPSSSSNPTHAGGRSINESEKGEA